MKVSAFQIVVNQCGSFKSTISRLIIPYDGGAEAASNKNTLKGVGF
jgi:hypothetical protein